MVLSGRDQDILRHVRTYRITTAETVKAVFFPEDNFETVKTELRRLRNGGFLQSTPLYARRVYYQLTVTAARYFGDPEEVAAPLGPQALPRAFGVLLFCCHGETKRTRLSREQFSSHFPDLVQAGVPFAFHDYYIDTDENAQRRLARIAVDLGGDYQRLIRKCVSILRAATTLPPFADLVRRGRFAFAIVTAEPDKARRLEDALSERPLGVRQIVEVTPDLGHVLASVELSRSANA